MAVEPPPGAPGSVVGPLKNETALGKTAHRLPSEPEMIIVYDVAVNGATFGAGCNEEAKGISPFPPSTK